MDNAKYRVSKGENMRHAMNYGLEALPRVPNPSPQMQPVEPLKNKDGCWLTTHQINEFGTEDKLSAMCHNLPCSSGHTHGPFLRLSSFPCLIVC